MASRRRRAMRRPTAAIWLVTTIALVGASGVPGIARAALASPASGPVVTVQVSPASTGIHQIKHVVMIMEENRSFDEYFGRYPGAAGIPVNAQGTPTVCVPDPASGKCVVPYHDPSDINPGGPHNGPNSASDLDGGRLDGFITSAELQGAKPATADTVMGYKLRSDIPNYWAYADKFVLQDHLFASVASWSGPSHLSLVSGWAARCPTPAQASSCVSDVTGINQDGDLAEPNGPLVGYTGDGDDDTPQLTPADYAWTDLSYLLYQHDVSWRYYRAASTPEIWNPLPDFQDVHDDYQLGNVSLINNFYADAAAGTLPSVSWVIPSPEVSDHPPASVSGSQAYVTGVVNALMQSPDWSSTAIFVTWDDWGGFYDHVTPPQIDSNGYGFRVPGLMISPYAKVGYVDRQTLSFDAYLKFIEDDFLGGQRLDPATDGRPDSRPDVRENAPALGDLASEFDFSQAPRPPLLLQPSPAGGVAHPLGVSPALQAGPASGTAPFNVNVNVSVTGATNPTASWTLDFGDGTAPASGSGAPTTVGHTYTRAGSYTVTSSIRDTSGTTTMGSASVSVGPATPSASLAAYPAVGVAPLAVSFDGSLSADTDDALASWSLNFGDGTSPATGTGVPPASIAHTYTSSASYTAVLKVTDQDANVSPGASAIVQVSRAAVPTVSTSQPTSANGKEVLSGTVNPNGDRASYHFEYGPTASYGSSTSTSSTSFTNTLDPVTALTPVLHAHSTYHYRLVATNETGTAFGRDRTFIASAVTSSATTGPATANSASSVTLWGSVLTGELDTSAHFDWGTTAAYGQTTAIDPEPAGYLPVPALERLTNLSPNTTYHYRLSITNSSGTSLGADATFGFFPPAVSTGGVGSVNQTTATVGGAVDPRLLPTSFRVQYGLTAGYGSVTQVQSLGAGSVTLAVSAALSGLKAGTTYHYRITATNGLGTANGADRTFRTAGSPAAITGGVVSIERGTITAQGSVDPDAAPTTYWFQYGPTTAYGMTSAASSAGMGRTAGPVQATLPNVASKRLYHYRLVASNAAGTVFGTDRTFALGEPSALSGRVSEVTSSGAVVSGIVFPSVDQTSYVIQYGRTATYGSLSSWFPVPAGAGMADVSLALHGLLPDTVYHYRLVATDTLGASVGRDEVFTSGAGARRPLITASETSYSLWILVPPACIAVVQTRRRRRRLHRSFSG